MYTEPEYKHSLHVPVEGRATHIRWTDGGQKHFRLEVWPVLHDKRPVNPFIML